MELLDKNAKDLNEKIESISNINDNKNNITEEEKQNLIKELPKFRYHPNVYSNPITTFANGICQCCGKNVKAYIEMMYSKENINCICFNCIADGSAAKKFDGEFIEYAEKINDNNKEDELFHRTPGYASWQGENWLACCDDYCEFIGDTGTKELEELGIAEEVFEEYSKKYGSDDMEWIKQHLTNGGSVAGYLFKCKKCGKYHLDVDMD